MNITTSLGIEQDRMVFKVQIFFLFFKTNLLSPNVAVMQGVLTKGEGSVLLASSLRYRVCKKDK
jgi:hypothetical protein